MSQEFPKHEGESGREKRAGEQLFAEGLRPSERLSEPRLEAERELPEAAEELPTSGDEPPLVPGVDDLPHPAPRLGARRRGSRARRLTKKPDLPRAPLNAEQRILLLDTWKRSGLPAADFGALVGVSKHTLYAWRRRFKIDGPAGLADRPRGGPRGSRLPDVTRRAILLMKEENPDWGVQRISDVLARGPALGASASAVSRVLREAGYEFEEVPTRPHPDRVRRFERDRANDLWQTDLFTFVLKRQNRRVYLVAFLDDHSRFIVGWGLHSTQAATPVLEVLRSAITNYNAPKEILTDNGSQYVTWRGTSQFARELNARGIKQIVARPRRPQTLGKVERFWGTLWRELLEGAVFLDLEDARRRLGRFIDHYNFRRPHQGIEGLTPADRFFHAAPKVLEMLRSRVEENALEIARNGEPKKSFYLTGQIDGRSVSVRTEGNRVVVEREGEEREEVELAPDSAANSKAAERELDGDLDTGELPPGQSHLDAFVGFDSLVEQAADVRAEDDPLGRGDDPEARSPDLRGVEGETEEGGDHDD